MQTQIKDEGLIYWSHLFFSVLYELSFLSIFTNVFLHIFIFLHTGYGFRISCCGYADSHLCFHPSLPVSKFESLVFALVFHKIKNNNTTRLPLHLCQHNSHVSNRIHTAIQTGMKYDRLVACAAISFILYMGKFVLDEFVTLLSQFPSNF